MSLGCIPSGDKWGQDEGVLPQPVSPSQLFSSPEHKSAPSIAQDQAATVPTRVGVNRELKLPGNRQEESACFSAELMVLERARSRSLEGGVFSADCSAGYGQAERDGLHRARAESRGLP